MKQRFLDVLLFVIPPNVGGRLNGIYAKPKDHAHYRPHLVISNDQQHVWLGVQFEDGPERIEAGQYGQVKLRCLYFDSTDVEILVTYGKLKEGEQVCVVEGSTIVAVGRVLRVWDEG
jgi:hypothetical protein